MIEWTAIEGAPLPLGATWVESARAWNFALYSKHAESVSLLLYAESDLVVPVFTYRLDYLRNKSGRIWHCGVAEGTGFRPPSNMTRFLPYSTRRAAGA
jgi:glycogen operon protein